MEPLKLTFSVLTSAESAILMKFLAFLTSEVLSHNHKSLIKSPISKVTSPLSASVVSRLKAHVRMLSFILEAVAEEAEGRKGNCRHRWESLATDIETMSPAELPRWSWYKRGVTLMSSWYRHYGIWILKKGALFKIIWCPFRRR